VVQESGLPDIRAAAEAVGNGWVEAASALVVRTRRAAVGAQRQPVADSLGNYWLVLPARLVPWRPGEEPVLEGGPGFRHSMVLLATFLVEAPAPWNCLREAVPGWYRWRRLSMAPGSGCSRRGTGLPRLLASIACFVSVSCHFLVWSRDDVREACAAAAGFADLIFPQRANAP